MTPHIEAKKEEMAKIVLMPGDPLRAKWIADEYLENVKLVSEVRNIYAYTGIYKGKELTVMASGMGNPSMGIYSYELFHFYNVDTIIRIGTCGAYMDSLNLKDLIIVENAYSESSFAKVQNSTTDSIIASSTHLNKVIQDTANTLNLPITSGTIYNSDVFYTHQDHTNELVEKYHCLGVEMESFALFHNANILGKQASCILSVSDSFVKPEKLSASERQNALKSMIHLSLESTLSI